MRKNREINKKILYNLMSLMLIMLFLTGCGTKNVNTTSDGTDMGDLLDSYDIMGVRYNLYSNGYAEIDTILNPYCELTETVTYEGKDYSVVKIVVNTGTHARVGIFNQGYNEAPEILVIPDTIQVIPAFAFNGCNSSIITLPSNVTLIAGGAFENCANIETVIFPDSLETLGTFELFYGCSSLKYVDLPEDVEYIGTTENLFGECTSLESASIPGTCGEGTLARATFWNCQSLADVSIGDGFTIVNSEAFVDLPMLEEIVFPDSITEIQDQTFYDCPNLKDVWLSDNLSDVPAHMFKLTYGNFDADTSGITIHVKESLLNYVQNLYPDATVVAR